MREEALSEGELRAGKFEYIVTGFDQHHRTLLAIGGCQGDACR